MIRKLSIKPVLDDESLYPASDGRPLGETDYHVDSTLALYGALKRVLVRRRRIHIACDMFLYYEQGNPRANKAPDVMVTKGVAKKMRRIFRTWVEGAVPCTVFEMVSASTYADDTVEKMTLYARLGVKEYVLFDPEGASPLEPVFQAFRLRQGRFQRVALDTTGGFTSTELGLRFVPEGHLLRLFDAATGERVPFESELPEQLEAEQRRRRQEHRRAKKEQRRAEEEKQRAEEEKHRADVLQAEVERLRAELQQRMNEK